MFLGRLLPLECAQLLADLYYFQAQQGTSPAQEAVEAMRWRADILEPMLNRMRELDDVYDPIQGFCDVLHHRYVKSQAAGFDVGTEAALVDWLGVGRPGYQSQ